MKNSVKKLISILSKLKISKKDISEAVVETQEQSLGAQPRNIFRTILTKLLTNKKTVIGGLSLIAASILANFLNFLFSAYLGRILDFNDFALLSLVGGFLSFASILF